MNPHHDRRGQRLYCSDTRRIRRVIRHAQPDHIHAEPSPEIGGASLVVHPDIEVIIKGPHAAAYLHRLSIAVQICRDILDLPDPHPDADLDDDMNGLTGDDPFNETSEADQDGFHEDDEDDDYEEEGAMDDDTANSAHDHR